MTVLTSVPFGVRAGQHWRATRHVIDVHRGEAALVVMRVPERKLLSAVGRAERVHGEFVNLRKNGATRAVLCAVHLLATIAKLLRPGGVRVVVAESLLLKHG
jgi:hypothetical protein